MRKLRLLLLLAGACSPPAAPGDAMVDAPFDASTSDVAADDVSNDAENDALDDAPVVVDSGPPLMFGTPCAVPAGAPPTIREVRARGFDCERLGGRLRAPRDVAVDHNTGVIYVTEMAAGRVSKLRDGAWVPFVEGLMTPISVVVFGTTSELYITDQAAHQLLVVRHINSALPARASTVASDLGLVSYMTDGHDAAFYISSSTETAPTGTVRRVSYAGGITGTPTTHLTGLNAPEGLVVNGSRRPIVAEGASPSRTLVFSGSAPNARDATVHVDGFDRLSDLAEALDGIYAADMGAGRLYHISTERVRTLVAENLAAPAGLFVSPRGEVYVVEHGDGSHTADGYLVKLTPHTR